jgi:hypothetical protein
MAGEALQRARGSCRPPALRGPAQLPAQDPALYLDWPHLDDVGPVPANACRGAVVPKIVRGAPLRAAAPVDSITGMHFEPVSEVRVCPFGVAATRPFAALGHDSSADRLLYRSSPPRSPHRSHVVAVTLGLSMPCVARFAAQAKAELAIVDSTNAAGAAPKPRWPLLL